MFQIVIAKEIKAPQAAVWDVISNIEEYPNWNSFVTACQSTFEVGTPIVMKVRLFPFLQITQKETIREHRPGDFLEYGINIPLGLLTSTRRHVLTAVDAETTNYESVFFIKGLLAPVVRGLLGKQLQRGFTDMTEELVSRSQALKNAG